MKQQQQPRSRFYEIVFGTALLLVGLYYLANLNENKPFPAKPEVAQRPASPKSLQAVESQPAVQVATTETNEQVLARFGLTTKGDHGLTVTNQK